MDYHPSKAKPVSTSPCDESTSSPQPPPSPSTTNVVFPPSVETGARQDHCGDDTSEDREASDLDLHSVEEVGDSEHSRKSTEQSGCIKHELEEEVSVENHQLLVCPRGGPEVDDEENAGASRHYIVTAKPATATTTTWIGYIAAFLSSLYDHDSFVISARVATSMTLASLFVLFNDDGKKNGSSANFYLPYPQWIMISAAVVSWQSQRDTASAVKKAVERIIGTMIGVSIGLAFGFLSVLGDGSQNKSDALPSITVRATILGVSTAIVTFLIPYISIRAGLGGNYASRLGVITFAIVASSFFTASTIGDEPAWHSGAYRALNIIIGCIVALLSLLFWPQSTKALIEERIEAQMILAGNSAAEVMDLAYDSFVNKRPPPHWDSFLILEPTASADPAYEAYTKGVGSWKSCNDLFPMLKYDPFFFYSASKRERAHFHDYMRLRAERSFRIQINLILLDSIVRGGVNLDEYEDSFEVLRHVGQRIQIMMNRSKYDLAEREKAAQELLENDLPRVRLYVQTLRNKLSQQPSNHRSSLDQVRKSITSAAIGIRVLKELESREQVAFFFELVEHLIIRASRLHYFCHVQEL